MGQFKNSKKLQSLENSELGAMDGVTAGTQAANKAVVADANVNTGISKVTQLHIGASGSEAQITSTPAELNLLDGSVSAQNVASKAVILDANGKLNFASIGSSAASASGLLFGAGTTGAPVATADADKNVGEIRAKSTATGGDFRNLYLRTDIGGAGGSGETIRALTDLTAAVATARGAHISLQPDDTGYVSGLGAAVDGQLLFGDAALGAGGTYGVLNAEMYSAGTSTDVSGCTKLSFFRAVNGGNATGAATVDTKAFIMELTGFTAAADATKAISSTSLAELPGGSIGLAIDVGGTRYYIPAVVSTEWN